MKAIRTLRASARRLVSTLQGSSSSNYDFDGDPLLAPFRNASVQARAQQLSRWSEGTAIDLQKFDRILQNQYDGELKEGKEYLRYHRKRFAELLHAMGVLLNGRERPKVLEIGVAQQTNWYKQFFPDIVLITADRPGLPKLASVDSHHDLDLNLGDLTPLVTEGLYDLIIFTEVIEHLWINPVRILRELLALLAESGTLYLTTPNFFSLRSLQAIAERRNPQYVYPDSNEDFHYHVREFCMSELLHMMQDAGGEVLAWYFSDCWDIDPCRYDERSNMVITARRRR